MIEHIKRVVSEFMGNFTFTKYGQISAYNPDDYTVKVLILPNLTDETGFIPLSAPWVGNNFGAVFGPGIGDSVRLDFMDGRVEATVVGGRFFNNSARPPVVQSGQAAIVDSKGSYVKLNNDGTVTISAAATLTLDAPAVAVNASASFTVTSPEIVLDGQMTQGTAGSGYPATLQGPITVVNDVTADGISMKNHYHSNSGGSGNGGPPVPGS